MKLNNNDDSHNSGLNLLIYNMLLDIESHPAWVCGLKLQYHRISLSRCVSHPAWVCGLKPTKKYPTSYLFLSHPAWVCGLKLSPCSPTKPLSRVTPCVGVWIETRLMSILV